MLDKLVFLRRVYECLNTRDIDGVLASVHPDVVWANGQDGGYVHGHDGLRRYCTRQWGMIHPHVEPMDFSFTSEGEIVVAIRQIVRDPSGKALAEGKTNHVFRIEDGLITRFDIRASSSVRTRWTASTKPAARRPTISSKA